MKKLFVIILIINLFPIPVYSNSTNIQFTNTLTKIDTTSFGESNFAVDNNGNLWTWGENRDGQLGDGTTVNKTKPKIILEDVISVSFGSAIKKDNSLWVWGKENSRIWNTPNYTIPTKVMEGVIWVDIGQCHTLYIKNDKSLWGCGYNGNEQIGKTSSKLVNIPVKIMDNVKKAVVGYGHSVILKEDGSVWTLGDNTDAQLGNGTESVVAGYDYWENNDYQSYRYNPEPYKVMNNIKDIYAGETSSYAIDENNTLWVWGSLLGEIPDTIRMLHYKPIQYAENVKCVNSQTEYTLVVKEDNSLWMYGLSGEIDAPESTYFGFRLDMELPMKLAEDVNYVSGWRSDYNKALILKNNGELYEIEFISQDGKSTCTFTKVLNNIKTPDGLKSEEKFTDISNKPQEVQKAVNALWTAGIISGTSETEFSPDKPVTRAEIAALLLRMTGKEEASDNGGFTDVTSDKWYYGVAGASKKENIIAGYDDNTFRGDEVISKEQIISLASRTLNNSGFSPEKTLDILPFKDTDKIPQWAIEDIKKALSAGIIEIPENGLFNPGDKMTRGEAAIILYNLYNII